MGNKGKVVTLEDRIPKLKEQRRQKANRRLVLYICIFFLLLLAIVYFTSPLSKIGQVNVSGNHYVEDDAIIEAGGLTAETGFWNVDRKEAASRIEQMKEIRSAEVTRQFPNHLTVHIEEYDRAAYMKKDNAFFPILENGARLSALDDGQVPVNAPILVDWPEGEKLAAMAGQLKDLPESLVHRISEIYYTPIDHFPNAITVYMNDGFEVRASIDDFAQKMKKYPEIIANIHADRGIIHMRVNVYFEKKDPSNGKKK